MRPLDKGPCPTNAQGNRITVSDYAHWRAHLIDRIGYYCAYCNMPLSHSLQVEHVVPINPPPGYLPGDPLEWNNILLACGPCNNAKSNTPINFADYYFPEENNTLLAFQIVEHTIARDAAIVDPKANLEPNQVVRALETIDLLDLDNIDRREAIVDIRWRKRRDAMKAVDSAFRLYSLAKNAPGGGAALAAAAVVEIARSIGFFGLWFDIFQNEPIVIQGLVDGIPGTAQDCFDPNNGYCTIPRNPGNVVDPI